MKAQVQVFIVPLSYPVFPLERIFLCKVFLIIVGVILLLYLHIAYISFPF